ncbi:MAG: NUDIX domain-containing protein [Acidimicrobiales bacterium]
MGAASAGEAPWEGALREAIEETGLPVQAPVGGPELFHLDAHPAGEHFLRLAEAPDRGFRQPLPRPRLREN